MRFEFSLLEINLGAIEICGKQLRTFDPRQRLEAFVPRLHLVPRSHNEAKSARVGHRLLAPRQKGNYAAAK